jgi:hypothetical protein
VASQRGDLDILRLVHSYHPSSISALDSLGGTPLHAWQDGLYNVPSTAAARMDALRFLLKLDPTAVTKADNDRITPYAFFKAIARDRDFRGFEPVIQRLLLRAASAHDPATLKELNYAERRGAMYLLFAARFASPCGGSGDSSISSAAATAAGAGPAAAGQRGADGAGAPVVQAASSKAMQASSSGDSGVWVLLREQADSSLHRLVVSYL